MESFKFFSKNNNNNSGYNDLERGWCETIFHMISNGDNLIEGRKYRVHHLNDELRFVITNSANIINHENFEPIKIIRVLFSVNDINIYTLIITSTFDLTDMLSFNICLSNENDLREFYSYGGF